MSKRKNATLDSGGAARGRPITFGIKFWFGVGQAAEGIKNAALSSLLLFYYSQVLGLEPSLAGLALLVGVVTDGISDAIVGSLSDSLKHKWGRRHPFMYAAALPFGISFAALFLPPPDLTQTGLFLWLLAWVIIARNFMTLYVIPHYALGAELSDDHEERTRIVAYRAFFGYLGGGAIFVAGRFLFYETPAYAVPQLNPLPYMQIGLIFGGLVALLIFLSALGTHSVIPNLPKPSADIKRFSADRLWREVVGVCSNRAFRIFVASFFLWAIALYVSRTLEIYMGTYFWRLDKNSVFLLPVASIAAMLAGTFFWTAASKRIGKKNSFIYSISIYCAIFVLLPTLKVLGFFPAEGSTIYVITIFTGYSLAAFAGASPPVVAGSMLADIADQYELEAGVRQEGIFFGAINLATKFSAGIGAQLAGILLTLIALARNADPATVSQDTIVGLGMISGVTVASLGLLAAFLYRAYPLTKAEHLAIQRALAARDDTAASPTRLQA